MGIDSAVITPLMMSVLPVVFPKEEQPKAIAAGPPRPSSACRSAGSSYGWGDAHAGAIMVAAFVAWTRRTARPLIDLSLFRDRRFIGGAVPATPLTFALFGVLFVTPQYFRLPSAPTRWAPACGCSPSSAGPSSRPGSARAFGAAVLGSLLSSGYRILLPRHRTTQGDTLHAQPPGLSAAAAGRETLHAIIGEMLAHDRERALDRSRLLRG